MHYPFKTGGKQSRGPCFCEVRYCKRPLFDGLTPLTAAVVHFACAKPWDWMLGAAPHPSGGSKCLGVRL